MRINLIVLLKSTTIMLMVVAFFCAFAIQHGYWYMTAPHITIMNDFCIFLFLSLIFKCVASTEGFVCECVLNLCACANGYDVQQASNAKQEEKKTVESTEKYAGWYLELLL